MYYLHSRLSEFSHLGQLFSGVNIRVMGSFESLLQFLQLLGRKRGTTSALLPLEGEVRLRLHIRRFIHSTACSKTFTFTVTLCCHSSFTILLPPQKKEKKKWARNSIEVIIDGRYENDFTFASSTMSFSFRALLESQIHPKTALNPSHSTLELVFLKALSSALFCSSSDFWK